jgi:hypothetical protein
LRTLDSVDELREQLRVRGYLSHGIERWFAFDPWRSRAFWVELSVVALKAAVLIGAFGALPYVAVMIERNDPVGVLETLEMFVMYATGNALAGFLLVVLTALVLKIRPELPIDTPGALLGISIATGGALVALFAIWWNGFDADAAVFELIAGLSLATVFFVVSTIVTSAALLSFSIYELQRIPAIHQRSRAVPMSIAAALLIALLFVPAYGRSGPASVEPVQIVTTPTNRRVALIAVDGLSWEIARSKAGLLEPFITAQPAQAIGGASTTERWASLGTGVPASLHGVRSVEGVKLPGGHQVLQSVSRADVLLRTVGTRQPLPPTVRQRHYVWEVFAGRGVTVAAVNWWTTEEAETIFAAARGDALRVDALATRLFLSRVRQAQPQFATVFLPSLDIVLNRLRMDESTRLAASIRVLDGIVAAANAVRSEGYEVVLAGMPGDSQHGQAVIAATFPINTPRSAFDVTPTLCDILGFPATAEMPGKSLTGGTSQPRIATFGGRTVREPHPKLNQEYYESLKSLGYIK